MNTPPPSAIRHPKAAAAPWWRRLFAFRKRESEGDAEVTFPPGFLESLERARLLALKAAGGGLQAGHRLGAYKGGQLEFHDHRAYSPGDDLRYLDWNLYARLGKPFVKQFAREEAGQIHLLLDATASMRLGAPGKWTFARRVAALFAHVGWSAHDAVRAYIFRGPGKELAVYPPRGGSGGTRGFVAWLQRQPAAPPFAETIREPDDERAGRAGPPEGACRAAVRAFLRGAPLRGRVFFISDFWFEESELSEAFQRLGAGGFDLSALHVLAPEEFSPPEPGPLRVFSLEEDGEVELDATPSAAARYAAELEAHASAVESLLRRRGGLYLLAASDTPLERVLLQTLRRRRWLA